MANPAPCQACLETPDAEFCVTNRLGVPWPFEQAVVNVCVPCLINLGITMGEALQAAIAELEAQETPGALEAIEADEGKARVSASGRKRRPAKKASVTVLEAVPETTEPAPASDEQQ